MSKLRSSTTNSDSTRLYTGFRYNDQNSQSQKLQLEMQLTAGP